MLFRCSLSLLIALLVSAQAYGQTSPADRDAGALMPELPELRGSMYNSAPEPANVPGLLPESSVPTELRKSLPDMSAELREPVSNSSVKPPDFGDPILDSLSSASPLIVFIDSQNSKLCDQVRPLVDELQNTYRHRATFMRLDSTNEDTRQKSRATAKTLGIAEPFSWYEYAYPAVLVFNNKGKCVGQVFGKDKMERYTRAIDKALLPNLGLSRVK